MTHIVITGVGPDKPGIVAGLTHVLMQHGCNLEDSRMTILAGEFAVIVIAAMPEGQTLQPLQSALTVLETNLDFVATVKVLPHYVPHQSLTSAGQLYLLRVSGLDKTGITYHTTQLLAERQLSITDLQSQRFEGEGGPVYMLLVEFLLNDSSRLPGLQAALAQLNTQLGVESHLTLVDREVL
jgi:glycine cleavage system transcriptional repressor